MIRIGIAGTWMMAAERSLEFNKLAQPIGGQILNLQKRQVILSQTRDLLLPKLISGKIDVSDLDIDIGATDV